MSYESIDPSRSILINKASTQATLLAENNDLKQWNSIFILSLIIIIGGAVIFTLNRERKKKINNSI